MIMWTTVNVGKILLWCWKVIFSRNTSFNNAHNANKKGKKLVFSYKVLLVVCFVLATKEMAQVLSFSFIMIGCSFGCPACQKLPNVRPKIQTGWIAWFPSQWVLTWSLSREIRNIATTRLFAYSQFSSTSVLQLVFCSLNMIGHLMNQRPFLMSLSRINQIYWVGKTWLPCYDHGPDHAMMTAWQPCFLAWSSWFMAWSWYDYHVFHDSYHDHGMIIMFSMYFFLEKNGSCVYVFVN